MDLSTLPVILVLARELLVLEPIEDLGDGFGGISQHRLQRHTGLKFALIPEVEDAVFDHRRDDDFVVWELAAWNGQYALDAMNLERKEGTNL